MIGSGYFGLASGACFADFGHGVTDVDRTADKVAVPHADRMPIYEPGLERSVAADVAAGGSFYNCAVIGGRGLHRGRRRRWR